MSYQLFFVSTSNPNATTGGGGCICSPERQIDCKPPYCIFPGNDMENIASPAVVVGAACARAMVAKLSGEVLAAGEDETVRLEKAEAKLASSLEDLPIPVAPSDTYPDV